MIPLGSHRSPSKKFSKDDNRNWLPISIEVHHALMDGLHVGRFLEQMQNALLNPETFLRFRASAQT